MPRAAGWPRITLNMRASALLLVCLLALWLGGLAVYFGLHPENALPRLLPPERVAAIVDLVESASPEERALRLRAVSGLNLDARISPAPYRI